MKKQPKYIAGPIKTAWGTFQVGEEVMYVGVSGHYTHVSSGVVVGFYEEKRQRHTGEYTQGAMRYNYKTRTREFDPNAKDPIYEDYIFQIPAIRAARRWARTIGLTTIVRLPLGRIFKKEIV